MQLTYKEAKTLAHVLAMEIAHLNTFKPHLGADAKAHLQYCKRLHKKLIGAGGQASNAAKQKGKHALDSSRRDVPGVADSSR